MYLSSRSPFFPLQFSTLSTGAEPLSRRGSTTWVDDVGWVPALLPAPSACGPGKRPHDFTLWKPCKLLSIPSSNARCHGPSLPLPWGWVWLWVSVSRNQASFLGQAGAFSPLPFYDSCSGRREPEDIAPSIHSRCLGSGSVTGPAGSWVVRSCAAPGSLKNTTAWPPKS